jgi:hypothetical protein
MRDGTDTARAFVRSAMYREAGRGVEPRPAGKAPPRPRGTNGARAPRRRAGLGAASRLTALALLGLLDLVKGG